MKNPHAGRPNLVIALADMELYRLFSPRRLQQRAMREAVAAAGFMLTDANLPAETLAALDLIFSDHFSRYEPGVFTPLRDALLTHGDHYLHLADLTSYLEADQRLVELYANPDAWTRQTILNVAGSGKFSSDRTIAEYAADIWQVSPCPVA